MVTNKTSNHQQGAVALITAMIVSVLLLITTAGMVAVTIKSTRQATDGAQSTKAYYAAESGVEEALLNLKRDAGYKGNCQGSSTSNKAAQTGDSTCIIVDRTSNQLFGSVMADESRQLDISMVDGVKTIQLDWGLAAGYSGATIPNYGNGNYPTKTSWPGGAPAVIELAIIAYPNSGTFGLDSIDYREVIASPRSNKTSDASYAVGPRSIYDYSAGLGPLKQTFVGTCSMAAPYQCSVAVGNLPASQRYVLRLKARYNQANFRVTLKDSANNVMSVPDGAYHIDVTARAGDTFRRVQSTFGEVPESRSGLDYVLYSDTTICKSFTVKGAAVDYGCPAP